MILTAKRLITGDGETVLQNSGLLLRDGRIAAVDTLSCLQNAYPEEDVLDYGEATILPGLIDMHAHLAYWQAREDGKDFDPYLTACLALHNAKTALQRGVTTLRDVYSDDGLCRQIVRAGEKGLATVPRLIYCNRALCITGGIDWQITGGTVQVDGEWECRKAVRRELRTGATWIKVMTSNRTPGVAEFTQQELDAIVDECHRLGQRAAAHASLQPALQMCIDAGFDTIEHGTELTLAQVEQMCQRGIAWTPTIFVHRFVLDRLARRTGRRDEVGLSGRDLQTYHLYHRSLRCYADNFLRFAETGVTLLAGTDLVFADSPFAAVSEELRCMVDLGLSPLRAIATATGNCARVLGMQGEIGTLAAGAQADLLVVDGDAAAEIGALEQVRAVYQAGRSLPLPLV